MAEIDDGTLIHTKSVAHIITDSEDDEKYGPNGGFTAVLSSPRRDRDGDVWPMAEWIQPLPESITLDADHGMSVATTIGSARPYFDNGRLMIDASFSSIERAQEVRTLVREKHIRNVSVAALTDKSKKDGTQKRELLNAGVVAIPANPDAVILTAKDGKPGGITIKVSPVLDREALDAVVAEIKAAAVSGGGDRALTQAIHDAAVHLGASCITFEEEANEASATGASDGANTKSVDGITDITEITKDAIIKAFADGVMTPDEVRELCTETLKSLDEETDAVETDETESTKLDEEQFKSAALDVLDTESPVESDESPAEAAAASVEEPAPAIEAADEVDEAADEVDITRRANHMLMGLFASSV